ncbi:MAG: PAS domain S-box protein [Candidatus Brocadiia bacterium]
MGLPNASRVGWARMPLTYALVVVASAVVIALAGYYIYADFRDRAASNAKEDLTTIAEVKVAELVHWQEMVTAPAIALQKSPILRVPLLAYIASNDGTTIPGMPYVTEESVRTTLRLIGEPEPFHAIFLLDSKGTIRLQTGPQGEKLGTEAFDMVRACQQTGEVFFSPLHRGDSVPDIHIDIIAPLLEPDGKTVGGAVLFRIMTAERLYPILQKWPTSSATGEVLLVRRDGDDVLFINELRHMKDAALKLRLPLSTEDLPSAIGLRGYEGVVEGPDYRGAHVFSAVRKVPGTDWVLVAKIDSDEALAPVHERGRLIALVAGFLLLAIGLLSLLFWRQDSHRTTMEKLEQELVQSRFEQRYAMLLKHASDPMFLFGDDERILEVNEAACKDYGYSREEFLQMKVSDLRPPESLASQKATLENIREAGTLEHQTVHMRKDSSTFHVEIKSAAVQIDGKGLIFGIVRDITERKHHEENLRLAKEYTESIIENANILIVGFDMAGRVTMFNKEAEQVTGYRRDEVIGTDWFEKFSPRDRYPEQWERFRRFSEQGILPPPGIDAKVLCRSGEERILSWRNTPMYEQGKLAGIIRFGSDITDLVKAEQDLVSSEHFLATIFDGIQDGISVLDERFNILRANTTIARWFPGKAPLVGKKCYDVFYDRQDPCDSCPVTRAFESCRPQIDTITVKKGVGETRWLELHSFPLHREGQAAEVVQYFRDVSDRVKSEEQKKKMEAQIQQAAKLESLGVLAGGIAHDFNNLLTSILGNAELALMQMSETSAGRDRILDLKEASLRAADLTKQMLAYSGKGRFVVIPINMNDLISEMLKLLQLSVSKNVLLKLNMAANLPPVDADVTQMRQVFMNLIINASEAIGSKSGVISISTGVQNIDTEYLESAYINENLPPGDYVYIELADNGCGMSPTTLDRIFDPFFTTKFTGRGLGLAAVLGIVRGHRGSIKVYSEVGKGTTFKLLFPRSTSMASLKLATGEAADPWQGTGTILVIDDEEGVRGVAGMILRGCGFTVLTAPDGREGVELFRERADEITAVLLDLTMPHLGGEDAFSELRRIKQDVPVILTSGYNELDATNRFVGKGLAGFVQKPFKLRELVAAFKKALSNEAGGKPEK